MVQEETWKERVIGLTVVYDGKVAIVNRGAHK